MSNEAMQVNEASAQYLANAAAQDVPPGYKRTEVGLVPDEWEIARLPDVCWFQEGPGVRTHQFTTSGVKLLNGTNISNGKVDLDTTTRYIAIRVAEGIYKHFMVDDGDILLATSGVTIEKLHEKVACARASMLPLCMNTSTVRFKANEGRLLDKILYFFLQSELFRAQIGRQATGSAQLNFGPSHLNKVLLPVPATLTEQRAIAEALSDVDGLLGALEALIAKKRAIKQAAMQQLLTGKTRLPGFSGEWRTKRLGEILKFQVGCPFSSKYFTSEESGLRLVKNRDLKADDEVVYYNGPYVNDYLVSDGDVLIGMDGDFLPCLWNKGEALLNQRVGRLRATNDLDIKFAYYFLREPLKEIERATSSTTVKHLSHGDVEGIIGIIPEVDEQTTIAAVLADMDAEIATLEARRDKTRALKQGMMQQLLTGRVRLVKPEGEH